MRKIPLILMICVAGLAGGCSPYVDDFEYMPRPVLAEIPPTPPQPAPPLTALASVIGVRRADAKAGIPTSVEIRLQLQNNGPQNVVFDPQSLSLTNADLLGFPPPIVQPPQPGTLVPGQVVVFDAFFPFPPGHSYDDINMETLQLRWLVQIDKQSVRQVVYYHRVYYYAYGPAYWDYPPPGWWGVHGAVVVHNHR